MVRYILPVLFLFFLNSLKSQHLVEFNFSQSQPGYSYQVGYGYIFKNQFQLEGGIRIQQNVRNSSDQNNFFYHTAFATNFKEHLGVFIEFDYYFLKKSKILKPCIYYKAMFTRIPNRLKAYNFVETVIDSFGRSHDIYEKVEDLFKPMYYFEQYIGGGVDIKLYKGLYFSQKIGIGIALLFDIDERILVNDKRRSWEFGWNYSFGLKYVFDKKKQD